MKTYYIKCPNCMSVSSHTMMNTASSKHWSRLTRVETVLTSKSKGMADFLCPGCNIRFTLRYDGRTRITGAILYEEDEWKPSLVDGPEKPDDTTDLNIHEVI